jgi:methyl-accepting chemotaxis protein
LAKASSEQATQVTNVVSSIELLSKLVTKVSTDTENIAITSEHVAQTAIVGQKATNDIAEEINKLYNSTKEVAKVINDLSETSGEISEITSVIHGIAEQTTLLALNASIEAARAGEHGKGFGVVANETGKLAEQSKQAAGLIADLVNQMRIRTEQAVHVMSDSTERSELGKNLASEATVTFGEIFDTLKKMLEDIGAVAKTAKQMAESNQGVTSAISAIAAISEQSSASAQEVSVTTEEQSASVEKLSALAEGMSQIADNLKQSVAVFNLKSK